MAVASKTWTAAYGRYVRLRITAQEVEVDTPNNRSKVRVTGQIYYEGGTRATNAYPQTYTVTVDGTQIGRQTSITYNLASGAAMNLTTYTSGWINHNSNGAKSVTVRGHITDGAGDTGTISQSYALTTIARASTLNSFSMPNHLKPGTTTTFNLGISRKSSSFTHDISLRDGNTVIASWTGQATPTTRSLTATQTNTLLKRMSSSTSRTMTLRVQTKSGSTNIGGALTRTATVYVHSDVKPTVEKLSVTIEGNAHAKTNVKRFVQNISKVSGKFTRTATGGASISSSRLQIRRKLGGADLQTINTNSGTFPKVVALNGPYEARGIATDSRGRSNDTGWVALSNFDVLAYSVPQITTFTTSRQTETETTVDIDRHGTFSGLSGKNILTIRLQKRALGTTTWTNVVPDVTTTVSNYGGIVPSTGHSVALSYEIRYYIVDQFGNSSEQISTVSTQRVVLDVHKNEGVGIGKIHEQGVLDVDGDIYSNGVLYTIGGLGSIEVPANSNLDNYKDNGFYHNRFDIDSRTIANTPANASFSLLVQQHAGIQQTFTTYGKSSGTDFGQWVRHFYNNKWGPWVMMGPVESGISTNGSWARFSDGTQICWQNTAEHLVSVGSGSVVRSADAEWRFPKEFLSIDTTYVNFSVHHANRWGNARVISTAQAQFWQWQGSTSSSALAGSLIAIGRWI